MSPKAKPGRRARKTADARPAGNTAAFIGGQDWSPTRIDLKVAAAATPDRATGTARFTPPGEKKKSVVTRALAKTPAGWRIAGIHWQGEADSLVAILSRKD